MIPMQFKNKVLGFSLVEMAVVLVILGFVLGALLLPLQAQRTQAFQLQTENTLDQAKKALLGYAVSRGRLPCPASATSNIDAGSRGLESPLPITGTCTNVNGYLPAATLGIQPTDTFGFAVDAWNNRIRYAVTQTNNAGAADANFTTANGMSNQGVTILQPNLRVCSSASGITVARCSPGLESNFLTNNAVAVIFSVGETGAQGSGGADEDANLDNSPVFVSRDALANGEFDHILVWISPYVLFNAMIEAGQLH